MGSHFQVRLVCLVIALTIIQGIHAIQIQYTVTNNAHGRGGRRFKKLIGETTSEAMMKKATTFVWFSVFKQFSAGERKSVQEIHLIVDPDMSGNSTYEKNGEVHEIHISAKFIRHCSRDQLAHEINALIFYEIAHILQWTPPENQISADKYLNVVVQDGIACFAALKANYKLSIWAGFGEGDTWNEKGDVTAQFLVYCNGRNPEFISSLNRKMREASFSESWFLDFFHKKVEDLWKDYKQAAKE